MYKNTKPSKGGGEGKEIGSYVIKHQMCALPGVSVNILNRPSEQNDNSNKTNVRPNQRQGVGEKPDEKQQKKK